MASTGKEQTIELSKLNLNQLSQLKQQLDQEIDLFTSSLQQLRMAQTKFQESGDCLEKVSPENEGKEILVPLTGSMYVPGVLSDVNKVLVDVGTGYFVEKDVESAKDYFKRKIKFVVEQMEKIQTLAQDKVRLREVVLEYAEVKLQAQLATQQQSAPVKT